MVMKVGDAGRMCGTVIAVLPNDCYIEVLAYGGEALGRYDGYIYGLGPRGGIYELEHFTSAETLRRKARLLLDHARVVEDYMRDVIESRNGPGAS